VSNSDDETFHVTDNEECDSYDCEDEDAEEEDIGDYRDSVCTCGYCKFDLDPDMPNKCCGGHPCLTKKHSGM
jgi:hypothetical protein